MPSLKKTLYYISNAVVTAIAVAIFGYGMSAQWSQTTLFCSKPGSDSSDGIAIVSLALFRVVIEREACPSFGSYANVYLFPQLLKHGGGPVVLQGFIYVLLALCLLFSAINILLSLYNSVSNPYETYLGPTGVYVCSSLSGSLSFLALVLYLSNVMATNMTENLVRSFNNADVEFRSILTHLDVGFCLVIPYIVLSLVSCVLIYVYNRAAYTQRKEQQKPEDAPKEIMMH